MPVAVKGLVETQRALRKVSPDLFKELQGEIRPELSTMVREAKQKVPASFLSGAMSDGSIRQSRTGKKSAFPTYDNTQIRKGLTYSMGKQKRQSNGWQALYSLLNKSAMGVVIEWAGRLPNSRTASQSNNPNARQQFIDAVDVEVGSLKQFGKSRAGRGRVAFAAAAENQGKAIAAIMDAIGKAEAKFRSVTQ